MTPRADLAALLERLQPWFGEYSLAKDILSAPCLWCGYKGDGYWQEGNHAEPCPWRHLGGLGERIDSVQGLIAAALREREPAERDDRDERIDDLTARLAQANTHLAELGFVLPSPVTPEPPTVEVGDDILSGDGSRWTVSSERVTAVPEWALGLERAGTVIWRRQP